MADTTDDGAALVEFAILAPLLLMLLFGIVSAGLAFNESLALTHSAREAGRMAATLPVSNFADLDAWLAAVSTQAIINADGSLDNGVPGRTICVAYVHPDGSLPTDVTKRQITTPAGPQAAELLPCLADGRPNDERRVQITVARDSEISVVLFSIDVTLDSEAVNRFEAGLGG
jgi:Flp pilus assembly protein TadG